jgi:hypothetical protein
MKNEIFAILKEHAQDKQSGFNGRVIPQEVFSKLAQQIEDSYSHLVGGLAGKIKELEEYKTTLEAAAVKANQTKKREIDQAVEESQKAVMDIVNDRNQQIDQLIAENIDLQIQLKEANENVDFFSKSCQALKKERIELKEKITELDCELEEALAEAEGFETTGTPEDESCLSWKFDTNKRASHFIDEMKKHTVGEFDCEDEVVDFEELYWKQVDISNGHKKKAKELEEELNQVKQQKKHAEAINYDEIIELETEIKLLQDKLIDTQGVLINRLLNSK